MNIKIKSIKLIESNSKKYDIMTKKNHNFFANNILVHNSTIYSDGYVHARSIDSKDHESRHWIKRFKDTWLYDLPDGWRVCGENMYAVHSIEYNDLESYFYVHSIWNDSNICLSYNDTIDFCSVLNLQIVPTITKLSPTDTKLPLDQLIDLKAKWNDSEWYERNEGFVIRFTNEIPYELFSEQVAKYVRKKHVKSSNHWMYEQIRINKLKQ